MLEGKIHQQTSEKITSFAIYSHFLLIFVSHLLAYSKTVKINFNQQANSTLPPKREEFLHSLEHLYREHYNLLYNYGLKMINNSDLVQDFIQDIFYKLCHRQSLADIGNVQVYLLRALRNTIYNYYTSLKESLNIDDMAFLVPEDDAAFSRLFGNDGNEEHRYRSMLQAIKRLPNQQKHVLYLYYIKGLSHKEISEILGINPQSSMNTLSRAVNRLRKEMTENQFIFLLALCFLGKY